MKLFKLDSLIVGLFLCLNYANLQSQTVPINLAKATKKIDEHYAKLIKKNKVVGASIAIIDNGKIIYSKGFGFADKSNNIKATPNTVYEVASVTKSFTALAVMQLHEKGLLDINESIKKYIPELTIESRFEDGNEIYIKDILTHTSGLPSDILNGMVTREVLDIKWVIQELNKQQTAAPNQFYIAYSNVGYSLLGLLIERVSGLSYSDYMQANIFMPLGMPNSSTINGNPQNLSKGYANKKEIPSQKSNSYGAGCISSSAVDLLKFTQMLLQDGQLNDKTLLSKKHIAAMEKNWQTTNTLPTSEPYGYGIDCIPITIKGKAGNQKGTFFAHSGDGVAFHAVYGYIPELGVGAVILTNTDNGGRIRSASRLLDLYLQEAKGTEINFAHKKLDYSKAIIPDERIIGDYNIGIGLLKVKRADKVKFKMDGVKAVFKRKVNTNDYTIKAILWGFIPIKIKDVIFRFEQRNNQIYVNQVEVADERGEYLGRKSKKVSLSSTWKNQLGNYKITNAYPSDIPDFDFANATAKLTEEDGWVLLSIKTPGMTIQNYLNILSDNVAVTGGVGRHAGTTVKILDNGRLYFSGFELTKIN